MRTDPSTERFIRYLASKKSVDDRALNAHVARSFRQALPGSTPESPLRLLEVGAGIGTMIERLLEWDVLSNAAVTAVDEQEELLIEARRRLRQAGEIQGYAVSEDDASGLELRRRDRLVRIDLVPCEVFDFARRRPHPPRWDVLLAHAFLDLVDLTRALAALTALLNDSALLYLTINFDGATIFLPEIDTMLDHTIERLYHKTMDDRRQGDLPSGHSHTGRRLFSALPAAGAEIVDAGSSDWMVFADRSGYPSDESYFLEWILDSHANALKGYGELDPARFAEWIAERRRQIARGELIYITHQLDFLARLSGEHPRETDRAP
jgi:hypothetical protein